MDNEELEKELRRLRHEYGMESVLLALLNSISKETDDFYVMKLLSDLEKAYINYKNRYDGEE